ncbi:M28 family metallopeptidase [Hyunsoonleella sp. 2307UL5-6]|uniref:M28 family metallopeptidase n=1 Tax=Hyunsoonleella sp. 2307UL5-6 TaxID=3384768 RepID=UPI0039BCCBF0
MKKKIISLITTLILLGCNSSKKSLKKIANPETYAKTITASELKKMLYTYASDEFEGRQTGEAGQKKAVNFIKASYLANNIPSPISDGNYFQEIPANYFNGRATNDSENVIAYIEGDEKPDEVIIISAHLDHIGISGSGDINNGADDDGSGTVGILEIAEAFKAAEKDGYSPKRTVVFLHVTGEEIGLLGSRYYTDEDPIFPLKKTVANLNIDMIGRVDKKHEEKPNYLYLIGSDRLSKELHAISDSINKATVNLDFDYSFNDENDPNRYYYRSDHYNFAKHNIPVIFYFNGVHDDYHKPSDTADKINYDFLETRARLIFYTAWELANREERIKVD